MKTFLASAAFSLIAFPLSAEPMLSIPLPISGESNILPVEYDCGEGESLRVTYVNAGENQLAILPVDGVERVFVNVIAASGARYVAGEYEWWSKGDMASFTDLAEDGSRRECRSAGQGG
ncbi:MliC family protein [Paracoccus methylarcula]|nr:MliC family protein [Paracoccus methylarcula]